MCPCFNSPTKRTPACHLMSSGLGSSGFLCKPNVWISSLTCSFTWHFNTFNGFDHMNTSVCCKTSSSDVRMTFFFVQVDREKKTRETRKKPAQVFISALNFKRFFTFNWACDFHFNIRIRVSSQNKKNALLKISHCLHQLLYDSRKKQKHLI